MRGAARSRALREASGAGVQFCGIGRRRSLPVPLEDPRVSVPDRRAAAGSSSTDPLLAPLAVLVFVLPDTSGTASGCGRSSVLSVTQQSATWHLGHRRAGTRQPAEWRPVWWKFCRAGRSVSAEL